MIINTDQIISIIKTATASTCANRVYRQYPKARPKAPYITADVMTRASALICDNVEIIADINYTVDIFADKASDAETIFNTVAEALLTYGIQNTGASPAPVTEAEYYHLAATFREILDKRGNTYQST